jgi:hypothetical protein
VFAFRDHLTFLGKVMSPKHREMGLLEKAEGLATTQESFTEKQGIKLYGENPEGGSEAICHNAVVEDLALPGQIVIGTDSHTCMAGVLGCFAFGVGSTDMANAWFTKDIRIRVPETVRYVLKGKKRADVAAKDVMLVILSSEYMKTSQGIGKVLEFAGEEIGLLGSAYYASHPAMPLENAALMVNMDMIGRLRDSKVYIGGVDTAPELRGPVESAGKKFGFSLDLSDNAGFGGSSDHISFTAKQVPALFFFTGLHPDYHKPSDTWDKITAPQTARLLDMIANLVAGFREDDAKPRFTQVTQSEHEGVTGAVGGISG